MAKKEGTTLRDRVKVKINRKGVHSKSKTSKSKTSKNYRKLYNRQG